MLKKLNNNKVIFTIVNIIIFSFMLYIMSNIDYGADDYIYMRKYGTLENVTSFKDVLVSQYNHYFQWGGRSVAHILAQTFLIGDKLIFNILNSLVYIIFTLLIYVYTSKDNKVNVVSLLLINFIIWLGIPAYAECILWLTGSCNYLWTTTIILAFLLPFRNYVKGKQSKDNALKWLLIFLLGIIAGWTNENTGYITIVGAVSTVVYLKFSKRKVASWIYSGVIGSIIGYLLLIIAPGNSIRSGEFNMSLIEKINNFFENISTKINAMGMLSFILLLLILAIIFTNKRYSLDDIDIKISLFFAINALISIFMMAVSPFFPERALFGASVFFIISVLILISKIEFDDLKNYNIILFSLVGIMISILTITSVINNTQKIVKVHKELQAREQIINKCKQEGKIDIILDKLGEDRSQHVLVPDITRNTENWKNKAMKIYYNVNSIRTRE